jgi:hypothetical protein
MSTDPHSSVKICGFECRQRIFPQRLSQSLVGPGHQTTSAKKVYALPIRFFQGLSR